MICQSNRSIKEHTLMYAFPLLCLPFTGQTQSIKPTIYKNKSTSFSHILHSHPPALSCKVILCKAFALKHDDVVNCALFVQQSRLVGWKRWYHVTRTVLHRMLDSVARGRLRQLMQTASVTAEQIHILPRPLHHVSAASLQSAFMATEVFLSPS